MRERSERPARSALAVVAGAVALVVASTGGSAAALVTPVTSHRALVAQVSHRAPGLAHFSPPTQGHEFAGLGPCETYAATTFCYSPGEPVIAVGPSDVVETVNEAAAVYDKNGTKLVEFDFGTFWGGSAASPTQCTDPRALYIAGVDRFAISCSDVTGGGSEPMRFAISATGDPTQGWFEYAAPNTTFLDQDKIEATSDKFVIAGNTASTEVMYVYNLADVVGHLASPAVVKVTAKKSNIYEAAVEQSSTSPAYFVSSFPGNLLYLATITGTPAASDVHLSEVHVSSTDYAPPLSPQVPGGSFDGGDGRVLDAVYEVETSDGKPVIQYSSTRQCGARDCLTSARIDLSGSTPVLTANALAGEPGADYSYGAVGLDGAGDVFEAYARSSATSDPGAAVLGPGFDVDLQLAAAGTSACASGSPPCFERWGDYLGTAVDPSDPTSVWVTGLYQAGNGGFAWGTVIARVSLTTYALPTAVTGAASKLKTTTATVAATVNPHGVATTYHIDEGLTSGYDTASPETSAGAGTSAVPVTVTLSGLQPGTLYHYRIVATTAAGRAVGADRTFKTVGPKITSVVFTGTPSAPTITVSGKNFGAEPAGSPAGCGATGQVFGTSLWFNDVTEGWQGGMGAACIGLLVSSYTNTQVVFTFGSFYANFNPVTTGDAYQMIVGSATFNGTVAYTP